MASLYDRLTEEEWANLPPLVPQGADRETIINNLVKAWCTPLPEEEGAEYGVAYGVTLYRVALFDANRNEPIDLRELLQAVEQYLAAFNAPDEVKTGMCISLRQCRIDRCNCWNLTLTLRLETYGLRFGDGANFGGATFGDRASFEWATFDDGASFTGSTFGDGASFGGAKFGDGARFWQAKFGAGASFWQATFGDGARFWQAKFGDGASFTGSTFGDGASFFRATFGDGASFLRATFGDKVNLDSADLNGAEFTNVDLRHVRIDKSLAFARTRPPPGRFGPHLAGWFMLRCFGANSAPGRLHHGWFRLRWGFDWNAVRKVGELHVLTKASYWALLIVPLLNGVWPAVRATVNRYNHAITQASEALHVAADRWEALATVVEPAEGEGRTGRRIEHDLLERAKQRAQELAGRFGRETLDRPCFPLSWAMAFFAALAVAVGHLIYQIRAHELVRTFSRDAWKKNRADDFIEVGETGREDRLNQAIEALDNVAKTMPYHRHRNFVRRHGEVVWIPDELKWFEDPEEKTEEENHELNHETEDEEDVEEAMTDVEEDDKDAEEATTDDEEEEKVYSPVYPASQRQRIAIEEGAFAEYDVRSRETIRSAFGSAVCYAIGALLILAIVVDQSRAILKSWAGW